MRHSHLIQVPFLTKPTKFHSYSQQLKLHFRENLNCKADGAGKFSIIFVLKELYKIN